MKEIPINKELIEDVGYFTHNGSNYVYIKVPEQWPHD